MLYPGACGSEILFREKHNLWHIGRSDQSAYLYNLTGAEHKEMEATTTRTSGVQVYRCTGVQVYGCTGVQVYRCTGCIGVQVYSGHVTSAL